MTREQVESLNTMVSSRGFTVYLMECLLPIVRDWQRELITNTALSLDDRLGLQHAFAAVQEGMSECYTKAALDMPPWLKKELALDDRAT